MVNPFEDRDANFLALLSGSGEISLWPQFLAAPEGWRIIAGPAPYAEMINMIDASGGAPPRDAT